MKRILVVLLFLAVVSLGFSVTGSVYTRFLPTGYYFAEGWANTIEDLRVGRQGTGVTLNFDSFSLSYKLRPVLNGLGLAGSPSSMISNWAALADPMAIGSGWAGPQRGATSPGYLRIDGLKLGSVDLGVGGSWWTYGESQDKFSTNSGISNVVKGTASYNAFAFDLTYNIQAGDFRIHADPWNKTFFSFYTGSDTIAKQVGAVFSSNSASVSGYASTLTCNIDYSMEALSATVEIKAFLSGQNDTEIVGSATNVNAVSSSEIGAVLKLGYVVNELVSVFGDVGLVTFGGSQLQIAGTSTNQNNVRSGLEVPLLGGITLSPASAFQVNLGLGMDLNIDRKLTDYRGATNITYTDSRMQSEWDNYEMHGYHHPLIKFGADTKFAGDYSAGLRFIVQLNEPNGAGGNNGYLDQNTHDNYGYSKQGDWLNFVNIPDWDPTGGSSAYLGYDKDNFSCKLWTAGINANGLLGMFGAIDMSIKF